VVERFLRATLEGWQYALEFNKEAVQATLQYASTSNVKHQAYMLEKSMPLINALGSKLGWMDIKHWRQVQDILLKQKILQSKINIEDAYTTQFLEKIYK
jgi:ABC-type nitrate/sulfonate/bicarbonate transport system substrate-binding protein